VVLLAPPHTTHAHGPSGSSVSLSVMRSVRSLDPLALAPASR
jgi:hypothetical protein